MAIDAAISPTEGDARKLVRVRGGVLSLYLDFEPSGGERRSVGAALKQALDAAAESPYASRYSDRFEQERLRVVREFRGYRLRSRSVIVFSCLPRDVWQVYELRVPVRALGRFAERPVVAPLTAVLDEHERYGVVVIDKEQARIRTVYLGAIEHQASVAAKMPGRSAAGGWSQARYARHRDDHLHRYLLRVGEALRRQAHQRRFDRLIISGPEEARQSFMEVLPKRLRERVVGLLPGELFASDQAVLERVQTIEEQAERSTEEDLVNRLIDTGKGTGAATLGWSQTLQALSEGRVYKLVLAQGATRRGRVCSEDHAAAIERIRRCPICGKQMQIRDVAEWAVERAYDTDASVEEVRAKAATTLRREGGVAAALRY